MTLIDLADQEQERLHEVAEKYQRFVTNAERTVTLLAAMVPGVSAPAPSFVAFYSQAKKHCTLAFLSLLRGHRTQYKLTLRYFLEALVQAAYAAFHREASEYWDMEANKPVKQDIVVDRAHKWLTEKYPITSDYIREVKTRTNRESSHANFAASFVGYGVEENGDQATPFFDKENDIILKSDLLECTRAASLAIDLLIACSRDTGVLVLWPETQSNWSQLSYATDNLFAELKADPRWQPYFEETRPT